MIQVISHPAKDHFIFHVPTLACLPMSEGAFPFTQTEWSDLLRAGDKINFKKGQFLFYEGHEPYGIFVILSGKIQITSTQGRCPKEPVWHSPQGEPLGLGPLVQGRPFCCSGQAASDCEVLFIPKTFLMPTLQALGRPPKH